METARFRLLEGFFHNLLRNACDFDVHLQRGDAVGSPCDLEVHITKVIFITKDVCQNSIGAVIFKDQTHRNTSNRRLERDTGIHHRQ